METWTVTSFFDVSNMRFSELVPGFFFGLGVRSPDVPLQEMIPNHSPLFDSDEDALIYGVRAMASLAVDYLTGNNE